MRYQTTNDRIRYWLFVDRIPVTKLVILANVLTFLIMALTRSPMLMGWMGFNTARVVAAPWTVFTYTLVAYMGPISLLFACYWLWWAGGTLERSWGSGTYGVFFFGVSAITVLSIFAGTLLFQLNISVVGLWLPIAAITVAYAMLAPDQQILFFFVLPLKLKYLALIDIVLVLVSYRLPLGIFALAGCAVGYFYVTKIRVGSGYHHVRNESYRTEDNRSFLRGDIRETVRRFNLPARYREHRERERLRRLFERSNYGDK